MIPLDEIERIKKIRLRLGRDLATGSFAKYINQVGEGLRIMSSEREESFGLKVGISPDIPDSEMARLPSAYEGERIFYEKLRTQERPA